MNKYKKHKLLSFSNKKIKVQRTADSNVVLKKKKNICHTNIQ